MLLSVNVKGKKIARGFFPVQIHLNFVAFLAPDFLFWVKDIYEECDQKKILKKVFLHQIEWLNKGTSFKAIQLCVLQKKA